MRLNRQQVEDIMQKALGAAELAPCEQSAITEALEGGGDGKSGEAVEVASALRKFADDLMLAANAIEFEATGTY